MNRTDMSLIVVIVVVILLLFGAKIYVDNNKQVEKPKQVMKRSLGHYRR